MSASRQPALLRLRAVSASRQPALLRLRAVSASRQPALLRLRAVSACGLPRDRDPGRARPVIHVIRVGPGALRAADDWRLARRRE
ncbi:MAG: hypothetical protein IPL61_08550 [Myxococcales bacterium]|nr:hypothetical protein [Myxococcales bacterium]